MFSQEFIKNLKNKKGMLVLIVLGAMILSLVFSFVQTFEYKSEASIYVIQHQEGLTARDAYAAAKSAEKLAKNMSRMIYTSTFMERIFETNYGIDRNILPSEEIKKRKEWNKKIETYVVPETGILDISVYDSDKVMAEKITQAIIYVLVTEGQDFHGGGEEVEVKIADAPIVSKYPARPNVFVNLGVSFILGLVLALVIVFLTTPEVDNSNGDKVDSGSNGNNFVDKISQIDIDEKINPIHSKLNDTNRKLDFLTRRDDKIDYQKITKSIDDKLDLVREELYDLVVEQKNNIANTTLNLKNEVANQFNDLKSELNNLAQGIAKINVDVDFSGVENSLNENKQVIKNVVDEIKKMALVESVRDIIANRDSVDQAKLKEIDSQLDNLATKDNIRLVINKQKENSVNPEILETLIAKVETLSNNSLDNNEVIVALENINQGLKGILDSTQKDFDNDVLENLTGKIDSLLERQSVVNQRLDELSQTQDELNHLNQRINQLADQDVVTKNDLEDLIARQNELLGRENERNNKYKDEAERIRQNLAQLELRMKNYVTKDNIEHLTAKQEQYLSKNDLRRLIQSDSENNVNSENQGNF